MRAIRKIIAQKCVERRRPLVALQSEVLKATGMTIEAVEAEAFKLRMQGKIDQGRTLNDKYYILI